MKSTLSNIPPTTDLFAPQRITELHIHYYPGRTFVKQARGTISFKHGSFESEKEFDGAGVDDIIGQMRTFLESLGVDVAGEIGKP